jgi:hypothetical protein
VAAANTTSTANSSDLPSFVQDNPWLEVLSGKAVSETGTESSASVESSGLPSFAVDNPWLAILARR